MTHGEEKTTGQIAYEAFCAAEGVTRPWSELPDVVRDNWEIMPYWRPQPTRKPTRRPLYR